ncbi:MAG: cation diffusion facilitator family transporter [Thiohalomonadaceae bacterium]
MGGAHHDHGHDHASELDPHDARYGLVRRVTLVGAVVNFVVAVVKLVAGFLGQSQALIADGFHSLADLAGDFLVLFAAKHGSRAADEDHPYGHARIETLATLGLGIALIATGLGVAWDAVSRLMQPDSLLHPGYLALGVAFLSIFAKEWVFHYTMRFARRLNSSLLRANAWHSRSDAIASGVAVIGIGGTLLGYTYFDAVAALVVAWMIAKIGWDLAWQGGSELIDTGVDAAQLEAIRGHILAVDGVLAVHTLRTRRMGGGVLVDVHVLVDPRLSVSEGHYISQAVHDRMLTAVPEVQDVLVHVDPEDDETYAPTRGLPSRSEVLAWLRPRWAKVPGAQHISQITLHYLDGRVAVEIALPLASVEGLDDARRLADALSASAEGFAFLAGVRTSFY